MRSVACFFFLLLFVCSCCPKVECIVPSPGINLMLYGYNRSELDSVNVTGYEKGSGFVQVAKENELMTLVVVNDTIFTLRNKYENWLFDEYDWEISLPRVNRTFRISEYIYGVSRCSSCVFSKGSEHQILFTCQVNGVTYKAANPIQLYKR